MKMRQKGLGNKLFNQQKWDSFRTELKLAGDRRLAFLHNERDDLPALDNIGIALASAKAKNVENLVLNQTRAIPLSSTCGLRERGALCEVVP